MFFELDGTPFCLDLKVNTPMTVEGQKKCGVRRRRCATLNAQGLVLYNRQSNNGAAQQAIAATVDADVIRSTRSLGPTDLRIDGECG